jgi:hypothetical protein
MRIAGFVKELVKDPFQISDDEKYSKIIPPSWEVQFIANL